MNWSSLSSVSCNTITLYKFYDIYFVLPIHIFRIRQIFEKKSEYKQAVHQLFIDFKKAYGSVSREDLYNILIQFGIPINL